MAVQGNLTEEELEQAVPVIGVEFEPEHNRAVAYIEEGSGATEIALSYNQLWQLRGMVDRAISEMEWHNAAYVYAAEGYSMATTHLMRKGEHGPQAKTLCGQYPHRYKYIDAVVEWKLSPVVREPDRTKRNKFTGGTCQRCLAKYDKLTQTAANG